MTIKTSTIQLWRRHHIKIFLPSAEGIIKEDFSLSAITPYLEKAKLVINAWKTNPNIIPIVVFPTISIAWGPYLRVPPPPTVEVYFRPRGGAWEQMAQTTPEKGAVTKDITEWLKEHPVFDVKLKVSGGNPVDWWDSECYLEVTYDEPSPTPEEWPTLPYESPWELSYIGDENMLPIGNLVGMMTQFMFMYMMMAMMMGVVSAMASAMGGMFRR
ncbi:hypothetical protein DRO59_00540 [Candidatus Bathyarchaeota archaeon]|nr:MAG: hypothetical protein DRO59_00540 [Candidatus Bathyarchaeota archaeon]